MPIRAPGVSQIKTLAAVRGSGVHSNERHAHQFQLASLELEKTRRAHERQAAVNRIKVIDARLVEIDTSIQKHQVALATPDTGGARPRPEPVAASAATGEKRRTLRY
jgi:uncharacterized membrane protein YccC